MRYLEKIQGLLPLGYLYLIVLGLLKESVMFYQLDINILKYSSLTDILISPVADMVTNPILIVMILLMILLFFGFQVLLIKNSHKNWVQKLLKGYRINVDPEKKELRKAMIPLFVILVAFELLSLFVGLGIGGGNRIKKRLDDQSLRYNYRLTTGSDAPVEIYMIDINSSYYFYVKKGEKQIRIAPVSTINNLEIIKKK